MTPDGTITAQLVGSDNGGKLVLGTPGGQMLSAEARGQSAGALVLDAKGQRAARLVGVNGEGTLTLYDKRGRPMLDAGRLQNGVLAVKGMDGDNPRMMIGVSADEAGVTFFDPQKRPTAVLKSTPDGGKLILLDAAGNPVRP